jgi:hypothetical protein
VSADLRRCDLLGGQKLRFSDLAAYAAPASLDGAGMTRG